MLSNISISLKYDQQDATFSQPIYFYKLLYVFQAVPPPVIRSTELYVQRQVLSLMIELNKLLVNVYKRL